jgi:hypothetical protein
MRNPQGYAVINDPDGPLVESDTITCSHCQRIVFMKPGVTQDSGGFCRMCMKCICGPCVDVGSCTPFERKLEEFEYKSRFHEHVGTILR